MDRAQAVPCPACGERYPIELSDVVDLGSDPGLRDRLLRGSLNFGVCPHCGLEVPTDQPFLVLDPGARRTILFVPADDPGARLANAELLRHLLGLVRSWGDAPHFDNQVQIGTWPELQALLTMPDMRLPHEVLVELDAVRNARSWAEKGALIRRHPRLMEVDSLLFLTAFAKGEVLAGRHEEFFLTVVVRTLLERSVTLGVDTAVGELSEFIPVDGAGAYARTNETLLGVFDLAGNDLLQWFLRRPNLDDPVVAQYAALRAEETLRTVGGGDWRHLFHFVAGAGWRKLMPSVGPALAGQHALDHLREGIAHAESQDDLATLGDLWNELGLVLLNLPAGDQRGQYLRAVAAFETALEFRPHESRPAQWAASTNNLAMALARSQSHDWRKHTQKAIRLFTEAMAILADGPTEDLFRSYTSLGNAYLRLGAADRAAEVFTQALALDSEAPPRFERADCLIGRAQAQLGLGEPGRAQRDAEAAFELIPRGSSPVSLANAHLVIGSALVRQRTDNRAETLASSISHFRLAAQSVALAEYPALRCDAERRLGDAYLLAGDFESARASYGYALSAHETLYQAAAEDAGRLEQSGAVAGLFDRDAYAHLKCGHLETALERLDNGRSRWLTARLALSQIDLQALEAESRAGVSQLVAQVLKTVPDGKDDPGQHGERATLDRALHEGLANLAHALPRALTIADLQVTTPPGGALVSFVVTEVGGAALIVLHEEGSFDERNVLWLDDLTDGAAAETLSDWLAAYRESARLFDEGDEDTDASEPLQRALDELDAQLWHLAMGPLHAKLTDLGLETGAHVILLPPGRLALLPLHAARAPADDEAARFADAWAVSYAPSGFAIATSRKRAARADGNGFLVVSNPTADLPGTAAEAREIAKLLAPAKIEKKLPGAMAKRQAVLENLPGKRYVHFGCHGRYEWSDPLRSELLLAGRTSLTLADVVADADLNGARLVAILACESGIADLGLSPDDYIGFPAGFLEAGAPAVISTLWPVDDTATALFVKRFYEEHVVGGAPPAVALRVASGAIRDHSDRYGSYANPYYWAPFILTGA